MKVENIDLKSVAIMVGSIAAVVVLYKLFDGFKTIGQGLSTVFTSAQDTRPQNQRVTLAAKARNAIEQKVLDGTMTVAEAECALYPERCQASQTASASDYVANLANAPPIY